MSKFDTLYPNITHGEQIEFEGSFLFRAESSYPCWHCGEETHWIDGNFEAHLCSEECERAKWDEYLKALA